MERWNRQEDRKAAARGRGMFFLLLAALLLGAAAGAACALLCPLFRGQWVFPGLLSGIPVGGNGFFYCFSTLLLNGLLGLLPLFLLGFTAFGVCAVPLFLFFRGAAVGIGVSYFLWTDELPGWGLAAFTYTPAAAAVAVLLLLFAVRSFDYSRQLAKAGFSSHEGKLELRPYLRDLAHCTCWAVAVSLVGCLPAVGCAQFFS